MTAHYRPVAMHLLGIGSPGNAAIPGHVECIDPLLYAGPAAYFGGPEVWRLAALIDDGFAGPFVTWYAGCRAVIDTNVGQRVPGANNFFDLSANSNPANDLGGQPMFGQVFTQGELVRRVTAAGPGGPGGGAVGVAAYFDALVAALGPYFAATDHLCGARYLYDGVALYDAPRDPASLALDFDAASRLNAVRICDLEGYLSPRDTQAGQNREHTHVLVRRAERAAGRSTGSELGYYRTPEGLLWRASSYAASVASAQTSALWQFLLAAPGSWLSVTEMLDVGIRPIAIIQLGPVETAGDRVALAVSFASQGITPVIDLANVGDRAFRRAAVASINAAGDAFALAYEPGYFNRQVIRQPRPLAQRRRRGVDLRRYL